MQIPFVSFDAINSQIKNGVSKAIESCFDGKQYILGIELEMFENQFAQKSGVKHCIGVGNGFDALQISLKALGVGSGDEVLVPSHTFIATWMAVSNLGATPVPVDVDIETCTIDPLKIEERITKRTKAMVPVHLYGHPCDMDRIVNIANSYSLSIVEDNAQAHLAKYKGKITGSIGHINATSFYPSKNLGAMGDSGAITTESEALAEICKKLRNYGSNVK